MNREAQEKGEGRTKVQVLGIEFFDAPVSEVVERMSRYGGFLAAPSAPGMVRLSYDEPYRNAMAAADLVIADSGLMVLSWRLLRAQKMIKNSGLSYLKELLKRSELRTRGQMFLILPNSPAQEKALAFFSGENIPISGNDCYLAPYYPLQIEDSALVKILDQRRPTHILIGIGSGPQEKLGFYLRDHLAYRPAIHCIGAALGFLTGDQVAIPEWVDRLYLGWLLRLFAQPRLFIPRLTRALALPWMIIKYGERLPPLESAEGDRRSEVRSQKLK